MWWMGVAASIAREPSEEVLRDVTEASERLAALRGEFELPVVRVVDGDGMLAVARQLWDEALAEDGGAAPMDCAARAFGFATAEQTFDGPVFDSLTEIGGMYSIDDSTMYVRDADTRQFTQTTAIEHELAHARQHQHHDLLDARKIHRVGDVAQVVRLLAEGDAHFTTLHLQLGAADLVGDLRELGAVPERHFHENTVETYVHDLLLQPYALGAIAVQRAFADGGWDGVKALLDAPPLSTEALLHPELRDDRPQYARLDVRRAFDRTWTVHPADTLGAFAMDAVLWTATAEEGAAPDLLVRGWDGDRFQCAERPDGHPGFVWRTIWDSGADARRFAGQVEGWRFVEVVAERRGAEVLVTSGLPADRRERIVAAAWKRRFREVRRPRQLRRYVP